MGTTFLASPSTSHSSEKPTLDHQRLPPYGKLSVSPPPLTTRHVNKKSLRPSPRLVRPRSVLREAQEPRSVRDGWTNTDTLVLWDLEVFSTLINSHLIRNQWEDLTWERVDKFGQYLT